MRTTLIRTLWTRWNIPCRSCCGRWCCPRRRGVALIFSILAAGRGCAGDPGTLRAPAKFVERFFESYADNFDPHLVDTLEYPMPELLREMVLSAAPGRRFDILDLGCGTGLCGGSRDVASTGEVRGAVFRKLCGQL